MLQRKCGSSYANGKSCRQGVIVMITAIRVWVRDIRSFTASDSSLRARFITSAFWALVGAVVTRSLTLAASVVTARIVGTTGFGELGMIQSTVGMFGVAAGLGLGLTATKYVAEFRTSDPDRAGRCIALSITVALISGSVISVVFVVAAPWLATNIIAAPQLMLNLKISTGLLFFGTLSGVQTGALVGLEAFKTIAKASLIRGLIAFASLVAGVSFWGLTGAVIGLIVAEAVSSVINHVALRGECRKASIRVHYHRLGEEWPILWKFSLPALLSSMVVYPAMWMSNVLLVTQPNGYAEMGLFTAANKWHLLILFVPSSVAGIALPMLANLYGSRDDGSYRKILRANVLINIGLSLVPAVVVAVFSVPIMSVYGMDYKKGWLILVISSASSIPAALNNILGQALVSADSIGRRFGFDLLLAALLFAISWWLIPLFGAEGMALAYCVAFSATSVGLFAYLKTRVRAG